MTGLEYVQNELRKRRFTSAQVNSKVVAGVIDIISESATRFSDEWQDKYDNALAIDLLRSENIRKESIAGRIESARDQIDEYRRECKEYIDAFYKAIEQCETVEGKDTIKKAQMFVNSVEIDTKYDNTAFIIGLASILSNGNVASIDTLRKINHKIPEAYIV